MAEIYLAAANRLFKQTEPALVTSRFALENIKSETAFPIDC
jgi:hypothetical protein